MASARKTLLFFFLLTGVSPTALPNDIESGESEVQLIELYTSEGCSSCPDAESWFTSRINDPGLWKRFVPVAFHVDYWDDLGWPDPFARPEFTRRQRIYQRQGNLSTVYTPAFMVQGAEWRARIRSRPEPQYSGRVVGNLSLRLQAEVASLTFRPADPTLRGTLHLAWLGFGYQRRIDRGENAGRTLREDFIVLDLQQKSVVSKDEEFRADFDLVKPDVDAETKLALAAWFSASGNLRPIQAVGTWFPSSDGPNVPR